MSIGDGQIRNIDVDLASAFVCHMYSQQKENDVNAGRYNKLMQMTGKVAKVRVEIPFNLLTYFVDVLL